MPMHKQSRITCKDVSHLETKKRRPMTVGNWKMNNSPSEAAELTKQITEKLKDNNGSEVVLCPPFTDLCTVEEILKGTDIILGAQNCHFAEKGAYTGEISPDMLRELNVKYVIIGHSERRRYFAETDDTVNKKIKAVISHGMKAIVCLGESKDERESGKTESIVEGQLRGALLNMTALDMAGIVIAYEPLWAINTGITASPGQAQEVCALIRSILSEDFGDEVANETRILYGGSMNSSNAEELISMPDVDGGLIGSASLDAENFAKISFISAQKKIQNEN